MCRLMIIIRHDTRAVCLFDDRPGLHEVTGYVVGQVSLPGKVPSGFERDTRNRVGVRKQPWRLQKTERGPVLVAEIHRHQARIKDQ